MLGLQRDESTIEHQATEWRLYQCQGQYNLQTHIRLYIPLWTEICYPETTKVPSTETLATMALKRNAPLLMAGVIGTSSVRFQLTTRTVKQTSELILELCLFIQQFMIRPGQGKPRYTDLRQGLSRSLWDIFIRNLSILHVLGELFLPELTIYTYPMRPKFKR